MTNVRRAAVAGRFYPAAADALRAAVKSHVAGGKSDGRPPKAIIVPHAGYAYSGPIAGSGYAQLRPLKASVQRVVLIGPAHYVPISGLAASSAEFFETPLGRVTVDTTAMERILPFPQVEVSDEAHEPEHSLEVQLPFLQTALKDFRVVPLLVGRSSFDDVAEVLQELWGGPETLIVVSSDLSHFHEYEMARHIDLETAKAITKLRPANLAGKRACGYLAIGALLQLARREKLQPDLLDLRNSGDTAGDRDRVVGYGAFGFFGKTA